MLPKFDRIRLQPMFDAAEEAMGYGEGHSRAILDSDTMRFRAIVKCLEIVGERASRVSVETREQLVASVPWAELRGMRKQLIHAYFDVDRDVVWITVQEDVPMRTAALRQVLDA